jgi:hypothetical protein
MLANDLLASLGKVGKLFYDTMLTRLDSGNYPKDNPERGFSSIQKATSVSSPTSDGKSAQVEIVINLKQAPFAAAFEWGSGEHGEQGTRYPILPGQSPEMVFPLEDWPNFIPGKTKVAPNKDGIFFLTKVMHPGIEARPYIIPTILETKDDVKKLLAQDFKASVMRGVKTVEVIK